MSHITAGTKISHIPTRKECRSDKARTGQALDVRAMKRSRPDGVSLKSHAKESSVGRKWLERKSL